MVSGISNIYPNRSGCDCSDTWVVVVVPWICLCCCCCLVMNNWTRRERLVAVSLDTASETTFWKESAAPVCRPTNCLQTQMRNGAPLNVFVYCVLPRSRLLLWNVPRLEFRERSKRRCPPSCSRIPRRAVTLAGWSPPCVWLGWWKKRCSECCTPFGSNQRGRANPFPFP